MQLTKIANIIQVMSDELEASKPYMTEEEYKKVVDHLASALVPLVVKTAADGEKKEKAPSTRVNSTQFTSFISALAANTSSMSSITNYYLPLIDSELGTTLFSLQGIPKTPEEKLSREEDKKIVKEQLGMYRQASALNQISAIINSISGDATTARPTNQADIDKLHRIAFLVKNSGLLKTPSLAGLPKELLSRSVDNTENMLPVKESLASLFSTPLTAAKLATSTGNAKLSEYIYTTMKSKVSSDIAKVNTTLDDLLTVTGLSASTSNSQLAQLKKDFLEQVSLQGSEDFKGRQAAVDRLLAYIKDNTTINMNNVMSSNPVRAQFEKVKKNVWSKYVEPVIGRLVGGVQLLKADKAELTEYLTIIGSEYSDREYKGYTDEYAKKKLNGEQINDPSIGEPITNKSILRNNQRAYRLYEMYKDTLVPLLQQLNSNPENTPSIISAINKERAEYEPRPSDEDLTVLNTYLLEKEQTATPFEYSSEMTGGKPKKEKANKAFSIVRTYGKYRDDIRDLKESDILGTIEIIDYNIQKLIDCSMDLSSGNISDTMSNGALKQTEEQVYTDIDIRGSVAIKEYVDLAQKYNTTYSEMFKDTPLAMDEDVFDNIKLLSLDNIDDLEHLMTSKENPTKLSPEEDIDDNEYKITPDQVIEEGQSAIPLGSGGDAPTVIDDAPDFDSEDLPEDAFFLKENPKASIYNQLMKIAAKTYDEIVGMQPANQKDMRVDEKDKYETYTKNATNAMVTDLANDLQETSSAIINTPEEAQKAFITSITNLKKKMMDATTTVPGFAQQILDQLGTTIDAAPIKQSVANLITVLQKTKVNLDKFLPARELQVDNTSVFEKDKTNLVNFNRAYQTVKKNTLVCVQATNDFIAKSSTPSKSINEALNAMVASLDFLQDNVNDFFRKNVFTVDTTQAMSNNLSLLERAVHSIESPVLTSSMAAGFAKQIVDAYSTMITLSNEIIQIIQTQGHSGGLANQLGKSLRTAKKVDVTPMITQLTGIVNSKDQNEFYNKLLKFKSTEANHAIISSIADRVRTETGDESGSEIEKTYFQIGAIVDQYANNFVLQKSSVQPLAKSILQEFESIKNLANDVYTLVTNKSGSVEDLPISEKLQKKESSIINFLELLRQAAAETTTPLGQLGANSYLKKFGYGQRRTGDNISIDTQSEESDTSKMYTMQAQNTLLVAMGKKPLPYVDRTKFSYIAPVMNKVYVIAHSLREGKMVTKEGKPDYDKLIKNVRQLAEQLTNIDPNEVPYYLGLKEDLENSRGKNIEKSLFSYFRNNYDPIYTQEKLKVEPLSDKKQQGLLLAYQAEAKKLTDSRTILQNRKEEALNSIPPIGTIGISGGDGVTLSDQLAQITSRIDESQRKLANAKLMLKKIDPEIHTEKVNQLNTLIQNATEMFNQNRKDLQNVKKEKYRKSFEISQKYDEAIDKLTVELTLKQNEFLSAGGELPEATTDKDIPGGTISGKRKLQMLGHGVRLPDAEEKSDILFNFVKDVLPTTYQDTKQYEADNNFPIDGIESFVDAKKDDDYPGLGVYQTEIIVVTSEGGLSGVLDGIRKTMTGMISVLKPVKEEKSFSL